MPAAQPFSWILPEGMESPSPAEVARLERLRRSLLDLYSAWGYLQTSPPFVEFAALLRSEDLTLSHNLFEWTDPLSGRQLALRGDATAQVARVRTVQMRQQPDPVRLCYCLPVAHRKPESLETPRFYYQVGAELFGTSEAGADAEILSLMVQSLQRAGIDEVIVSLGHTRFFRALMESAGVEDGLMSELRSLLQRRAVPEIVQTMSAAGLDQDFIESFRLLANAHGTVEDLEALTEPFAHIEGVPEAIAELKGLAETLPDNCRGLFDLGDLHGRLYHRGLVFACFTPTHGAAVARGGRYLAPDGSDAVGFSANLWLLASLGSGEQGQEQMRVFAPADDDPGLRAEIERLRAAGTAVVQGFADKELNGCTHRLCRSGQGWELRPVG